MYYVCTCCVTKPVHFFKPKIFTFCHLDQIYCRSTLNNLQLQLQDEFNEGCISHSVCDDRMLHQRYIFRTSGEVSDVYILTIDYFRKANIFLLPIYIYKIGSRQWCSNHVFTICNHIFGRLYFHFETGDQENECAY